MSNDNPKCGFTLVELLVLVAIITILVAFLLPTLSKSTEIARRVSCMSLEKQLHLLLSNHPQTTGTVCR